MFSSQSQIATLILYVLGGDREIGCGEFVLGGSASVATSPAALSPFLVSLSFVSLEVTITKISAPRAVHEFDLISFSAAPFMTGTSQLGKFMNKYSS